VYGVLDLRTDLLPCGLFPFSVFLELGSHIHPWVSTPWVKVPPQRFSRSRGLDPPLSCRPCLVPVPLLGFGLSRSSSRAELFVLSDAGTLLLLTAVDSKPPRDPASGSCSLRESLSRPASAGLDSGLPRLLPP
jgi:hypothetical protein